MKGLILIFWILIILLIVYQNYYKIVKKNQFINHTKEFWFRALVGSIYLLIEFTIHKDIFDVLMLLGYMFFSFGLLFNILLNISRKLPWNYFGDDVLDEIAKKIPSTFYYWMILILAGTFGYNYVIGYEYFKTLMNGNY